MRRNLHVCTGFQPLDVNVKFRRLFFGKRKNCLPGNYELVSEILTLHQNLGEFYVRVVEILKILCTILDKFGKNLHTHPFDPSPYTYVKEGNLFSGVVKDEKLPCLHPGKISKINLHTYS
jgi:hypothetical protein